VLSAFCEWHLLRCGQTASLALCACAVAVRHGAADQAPLAASRASVPLQPGWAALLVSGRVCPWLRSRAVGGRGGGEPSAADSGAGRWNALNCAHVAAVGRRTRSTALATRVAVRVVGTLDRRGPTAALGSGSPLPHLRRDWARPRHICTGTGLTFARICIRIRLTAATSAPGLDAAARARTHTHKQTRARTHTYAHIHTRVRTRTQALSGGPGAPAPAVGHCRGLPGLSCAYVATFYVACCMLHVACGLCSPFHRNVFVSC
jgi:hypothetical protein